MIGEGGSGGAVAIALADRVLMQENAMYSVISPEGCATILWRDIGEARKAAAAFKPDAAHCLELGVIDGVVPEPEGGAHTDYDAAALLLGDGLEAALATSRTTRSRRAGSAVAERNSADMGVFTELRSPDCGIHGIHRVIPGSVPAWE